MTNDNGKTIVVVPCYNEEKRLPVDQFEVFSLCGESVKFIFVDDGSRDHTVERVQGLCGRHPDVFRFIRLPENKGKGEAVRQGLLEAFKEKPLFVGYWDADLSTPLPVISTFRDFLKDRSELLMIFGVRVQLLGRVIERSLLRHFMGRVFVTLANFLVRLSVYDSQCGAKLFRNTADIEDIFKKPFLSHWIFEIEMLARLREKCLAKNVCAEKMIYEYPLMEWRSVAGSKLSFFQSFKSIWHLLRIAWLYRKHSGEA